MNVYEIINNRIVELMEQGTVPWRKPWNASSNMPKNLVSKKEYRGVNLFLLNAMPYSSPYWLTFKQAKDRGGYIKQGQKSTQVIFWKFLDRIGMEPADDEHARNGKVPLLRYYSVFNLEQCEGVEAPEPQETVNDFNPIEKAEQIISAMPLSPEIRYGGNRAYYSPKLDYVQIPPRHSFNSAEELYATIFHECVHASGHESRLARKSILEPSYFGSHEYSKEELVAEMGAAFLCGHTGIEHKTIENSAAYIQGWLKELKNDKTLLVHAAAAAQKAADFILNKQGGVIDAAIDDEAA